MKRYTRVPKLREFQDQIAAEAWRIGELARGRRVIRDPSQPDRIRHHPDGPPVYVGETKQLHVTANDHVRDAGGGSIDQGWMTGRLKRIMKTWVVPKFEILNEAPTHPRGVDRGDPAAARRDDLIWWSKRAPRHRLKTAGNPGGDPFRR